MRLILCYDFVNENWFYHWHVHLTNLFQKEASDKFCDFEQYMIWFFIFCMILSRWLFHLSWKSSQISNMHTDSSEFFSMLFNHMRTFMLNFLFFEKCIKIYFFEINKTLYFLTQKKYLLWIIFNYLQFFFVINL